MNKQIEKKIVIHFRSVFDFCANQKYTWHEFTHFMWNVCERNAFTREKNAKL